MSRDDIKKHTLFLFVGDFDELRDLHSELTPSEVIRTLVRNHIVRVKKATPTPELTLPTEG